MTSISSIIENLVADPWREKEGFSSDIAKASADMFDPVKSDAEIAQVLAQWLEKNQPCLFGRMAAGALNLISYCILTERDLVKSDAAIREKIQKYRLLWKREAFLGRRSAFIILAVSPRILNATPDKTLMALAQRLGFLYLRETIEPDTIYHERLTLEIPAEQTPDKQSACYEWRVGSNVFAAQGDKRWWLDHRIPGGLGFSMNSVGHMARSGALRKMFTQSDDPATPTKGKMGIDSLEAALKFAMMTINGAQPTISGPATCLRKLPPDEYQQLNPKCPFSQMPPKLQSMDYTTYLGWYHTDAVVPSDYFRPDVERPKDVAQKELNFTYLFDDSIENSDFENMGLGGQIR